MGIRTLSAAVSALYTNGVNGPVKFTVQPGTYNDRINLHNYVSGASATNTITFDGISKDSVTLQYSGQIATVRFYNADYITIKNMTSAIIINDIKLPINSPI